MRFLRLHCILPHRNADEGYTAFIADMESGATEALLRALSWLHVCTCLRPDGFS